MGLPNRIIWEEAVIQGGREPNSHCEWPEAEMLQQNASTIPSIAKVSYRGKPW